MTSKYFLSLNRIHPEGITERPILCGSIVIEQTASKEKSNLGKSYPSSFKNGITKPPNAASTCKYISCFLAISAISSTLTAVFLLILFSKELTSIK